ncbi:hypothetical protein [Clostridium sp.]|uniref:hypothetical protein n=1 Tax=Clostridium sp. TaxID=1506 RepID=UPI001B771D04|nr:hypothetical protein [Clostridium sp.]MBP3916965.1 hypothetical protein [Clostridium sp.]
MRYLIDKVYMESKNSRIKYIYEAFKLNALQKNQEDEFIIIDTLPLEYEDIFFIIGHNPKVYQYLKDNIKDIKANNIVAITCNTKMLRELSGLGKNIFIPYESDGLLNYYDGSEYGFDFNITDCELALYNDNGLNIIDKINECMEKI